MRKHNFFKKCSLKTLKYPILYMYDKAKPYTIGQSPIKKHNFYKKKLTKGASKLDII